MSQEPVFSSENRDGNIKQFHGDVLAYCRFIDDFSTGHVKDPYTILAKLLANLAVSVLRLPFGPSGDALEDVQRVDWQVLTKGIGAALAPATPNILEYFKDNTDGLVTATMLDDDLTDIYADLKQGLDHYARGDSDNIAHAVWHWRYSYESHWGDHLFQAMKTVHLIRYQLLWT